jgi:hypothetical protein
VAAARPLLFSQKRPCIPAGGSAHQSPARNGAQGERETPPPPSGAKKTGFLTAGRGDTYATLPRGARPLIDTTKSPKAGVAYDTFGVMAASFAQQQGQPRLVSAFFSRNVTAHAQEQLRRCGGQTLTDMRIPTNARRTGTFSPFLNKRTTNKLAASFSEAISNNSACPSILLTRFFVRHGGVCACTGPVAISLHWTCSFHIVFERSFVCAPRQTPCRFPSQVTTPTLILESVARLIERKI